MQRRRPHYSSFLACDVIGEEGGKEGRRGIRKKFPPLPLCRPSFLPFSRFLPSFSSVENVSFLLLRQSPSSPSVVMWTTSALHFEDEDIFREEEEEKGRLRVTGEMNNFELERRCCCGARAFSPRAAAYVPAIDPSIHANIGACSDGKASSFREAIMLKAVKSKPKWRIRLVCVRRSTMFKSELPLWLFIMFRNR